MIFLKSDFVVLFCVFFSVIVCFFFVCVCVVCVVMYCFACMYIFVINQVVVFLMLCYDGYYSHILFYPHIMRFQEARLGAGRIQVLYTSLQILQLRATWNPKQPFINGCFNWMISNLLHRKWLFHETSIFHWLFGVPSIRHPVIPNP